MYSHIPLPKRKLTNVVSAEPLVSEEPKRTQSVTDKRFSPFLNPSERQTGNFSDHDASPSPDSLTYKASHALMRATQAHFATYDLIRNAKSMTPEIKALRYESHIERLERFLNSMCDKLANIKEHSEQMEGGTKHTVDLGAAPTLGISSDATPHPSHYKQASGESRCRER